MRRTGDQLKADCRAAALAEVAVAGLAGLTVEGVARRASAAKTSVYRHWASVDDLLIDALAAACPREEVTVEGGHLRDDLLRSLHQLTRWLSGPAAPAVAAVLAERRRRPDLVDALYRDVFGTHGNRFTQTVIEHYAATGEIAPRSVTPIVCDIGEALVIKHQIDTGELPDGSALEAIVDQAILPALGFPATSSGHA
ncbi:TetR/AcrR family transcriptional regulator [Mycolicibacterium smegmatis]|uniref:TetR/AcrR family transcriptional regulator n=1 Tax=Mycolicibacterium smegmatis TaxID=1772 RepID=UPI0005D97851|nr:TetR/AcrR family transcriptional regulator C-terminal ligand-binding domain-containing protein [Mycolicibacterium smegmatis]MDF1900846.1 TetR/AcrR family transcriptional regulator C-terminal ligand-binding domain-containing protein [Mycolicibacterium smegmatis]MDF1905353.1 TetR/AcrR family transcriptional regulator C-terminal ligand-binding domain-containing protein [Mycolicibacterium smegmatis]MDF1915951.1 TetR/AcrR family transcriptional regulator C-terminal ligand-binding domain-containing